MEWISKTSGTWMHIGSMGTITVRLSEATTEPALLIECQPSNFTSGPSRISIPLRVIGKATGEEPNALLLGKVATIAKQSALEDSELTPHICMMLIRQLLFAGSADEPTAADFQAPDSKAYEA